MFFVLKMNISCFYTNVIFRNVCNKGTIFKGLSFKWITPGSRTILCLKSTTFGLPQASIIGWRNTGVHNFEIFWKITLTWAFKFHTVCFILENIYHCHSHVMVCDEILKMFGKIYEIPKIYANYQIVFIK